MTQPFSEHTRLGYYDLLCGGVPAFPKPSAAVISPEQF